MTPLTQAENEELIFSMLKTALLLRGSHTRANILISSCTMANYLITGEHRFNYKLSLNLGEIEVSTFCC